MDLITQECWESVFRSYTAIKRPTANVCGYAMVVFRIHEGELGERYPDGHSIPRQWFKDGIKLTGSWDARAERQDAVGLS